ncbi:hypothetical protein PAMP_024608 [Pampus punctatissimus]
MHGLHTFLLLHLLTCLGRNTLGSEIIHGKNASKESMLYMASVQNNTKHVCGGFLISEDFVVTAAHCDNANLSVVLGTHNLKKVNDATMRYRVKKCKHPYYKNVKSGNDIMLLKLSRKAQKVKPIQLPKSVMKMKDEAMCRVAGWGRITGGKHVDVLQVADVPIINLNVCKKEWMQLPDNVICAGGYGTKKGFCQGDSGGPLVCGGIAVGVVSFNNKKNCTYPNVPNIYTDLSKNLDWIKNILKKKKC